MAKQPAETVKVWPLDEIIPYERNPRTHPDAQIALLARLMKEHGVDQPIVVDEHGVIIKGHGRLKAARLAGMDSFPVVIKRGLTEDQKRAERIADNQIALLASWDLDMIKLELGELTLAGYELPLLGFDQTELAGFLDSNEGQTDPDAAPPLPDKPIVRPGELWLLGKHRLLCGDCLDQKDIERLVGNARLDLVFTDPPYNVDYSSQGRTIENDNQTDAAFEKWLSEAFRIIALVMKPNACIYVCHPDSASAPKLAFEHAFAENFKKSSTIIWLKQAAAMGWQDYRVQHEPILYGWREAKKGKHYNSGDRAKTTVWPLSREVSYVHPTQKPVVLAEEAILNSSKASWNVGDFFAGSGSTLIACERSGRKFFGLEIDARFCSVIIERWEDFVGSDATLEGDGRSYKAICADRERDRLGAGKGRRASSGRRSDPAGVPSISQ
jgi:DNA modification methylase